MSKIRHNQKTSSPLSLVLFLIVSILGVIVIVHQISLNRERERVSQIKKSPILGEYYVLSTPQVADVYKSLELKSPMELIRKNVSIGGDNESLSVLIKEWSKELSPERSLLNYGRGIRLSQILYQAGKVAQAREVLSLLLDRPVNSLGEGFTALREVLAQKSQSKFKVKPAQLEEVLSIVALNSILELNLPIDSLIKEAMQSVDWNNTFEGPDSGKAYLMQLIGLYSGTSYYNSGLRQAMGRHWSSGEKITGYMDKPRSREGYFIFLSLEGKDLK